MGGERHTGEWALAGLPRNGAVGPGPQTFPPVLLPAAQVPCHFYETGFYFIAQSGLELVAKLGPHLPELRRELHLTISCPNLLNSAAATAEVHRSYL